MRLPHPYVNPLPHPERGTMTVIGVTAASGDVGRVTRADRLGVALRGAMLAARDFANSSEPVDELQRRRYSELADTLEAQRNSLKREVSTY